MLNYYEAGDIIVSRISVALPTFKVIALADASEIETSLKNQNIAYVVPMLDRVDESTSTSAPGYTTVEQNWLIVLAVSSSFQQNTMSKLTRFNTVGQFVSTVFDWIQNYRIGEFYTPFRRVNTEFRVSVKDGKVFVPLQFSTRIHYSPDTVAELGTTFI